MLTTARLHRLARLARLARTGPIVIALCIAACVPSTPTRDAGSGVTDPGDSTPTITRGEPQATAGDEPQATASLARATESAATRSPVPPAQVSAQAVGSPLPPAQASATVESLVGATVRGGAIGDIFALEAVRIGAQPNAVRVVWDLAADTGMPLYEITLRRNVGADSYPRIRGTAYLDVVIHDVNAMEMAPLPSSAPPGPVNAVTMLPFEDDAILRFGVDLDSPARYEVIELDSPVRLVIDVLRD